MEEKKRKTGIDIIGDVPWGTHFCQFYQTKEDLIDLLVPYFKAGLENNEFCMWVTSEPLGEKEAREAMQKAVSDLDQYLKKGQIEIVPYTEWYLKDGVFNLQRVLNAWIDKLNQALAKGYDGLRLTGNTAWLEKREWENFTQYEEELNNAIGKYQMIAICTYSLDKCGASEVIDVVKNHQFALIKREGKWESIENSERKKAEEMILSLSKFPLENPNPILRIDAKGEILYRNPPVGDLLEATGLSEKEIFKLLPENLKKLIAEGLKTGKPLSELEVNVKDRIYSYTVVPIVENKYVNLYGQDITERKRAEEQIAYQAQLLAIVNDAVVASDAQYRLTAWNAAAESMYGWKAEEVLGRFGLDITRTEFPGVDKAEMLRAIAERGSWRGEATQARKDGTRFPVEVSSVVLRDTTGKVTGFVSVNRDITERKRSEEEMRKKNKDLESFVYMVSHDLKNPVISIQGFCSLLLKDHKKDLNEKALFYLQRVQANASLMASLCEDLLELSRIGRIENAKREISVQEVIKSVWAGVIRSFPAEDVELIMPEKFPQIFYSDKRLYQIFYNLLSNAVKFKCKDKPPRVEIGYQENDENYTFFVKDNGIGIEQKYQDKIFELFSQLKETKSEGTGVGLAIVKKIVETNQSKVWVQSQKGAGSTFYFTIPKNI